MNQKLNSGKRRFRAWGSEELTNPSTIQSANDNTSKSWVIRKIQIFVFKKIVSIKKYLSHIFAT